nr:GTP cyclohydrolase 1 [Candidatus Pantoea persica]
MQRYLELDFIRGCTILGILLLNIVGFALPFAAYLNPAWHGAPRAADIWTWAVLDTLAQLKFLTLFCPAVRRGPATAAAARRPLALFAPDAAGASRSVSRRGYVGRGYPTGLSHCRPDRLAHAARRPFDAQSAAYRHAALSDGLRRAADIRFDLRSRAEQLVDPRRGRSAV